MDGYLKKKCRRSVRRPRKPHLRTNMKGIGHLKFCEWTLRSVVNIHTSYTDLIYRVVPKTFTPVLILRYCEIADYHTNTVRK